jgi:hypothetical protein
VLEVIPIPCFDDPASVTQCNWGYGNDLAEGCQFEKFI